MLGKIRSLGAPIGAQGLYSIAGMVVTLVGTLAMAPDTWGRVAIILSAFFIVVAFVRGAGSIPILVFLSGDATAAYWARRPALILTALVAALTGTIPALVGFSVGLPLPGILLGLATITYSLYDITRTIDLATGDFTRVVRSDAVMFGLLLLGLLLCLTDLPADSVVPASMVLAYGVGTAVSLLGQPRSESLRIRGYWRHYGRDIPFLALDALLMATTVNGFVFLAGIMGSPELAGAFRTAISLFIGPLQLAQTASSPFLVRMLRGSARAYEQDPGADLRLRTLRQPALLVAAFVLVGACYGAIALVAGGAISRLLTQEVWIAAADLALACALLIGALGASSLLSTFLRYRHSSHLLFWVRVMTLLASMAIFAALFGPAGAPLTVAIAAAAAPWIVVPGLFALAFWRPVSPRLGAALA
ncbi:hypothetical protein D9V34_12255 [Mycetocola lacteus]|uniref:Lipopolysaccharide biosynthesis protein n=1 Tax=Mycetocola lacteus TaxID=76637 RepID=A0A3L7AP56_9MICO|nr:hypothetical protein [Mycetocola lacteus]RLP81390.1 hypothetical protein D9V34_12255 [Mycetocola lacteus]